MQSNPHLVQKPVAYNNLDLDAQDALDAQVEEQERVSIEKEIQLDVVQDVQVSPKIIQVKKDDELKDNTALQIDAVD